MAKLIDLTGKQFGKLTVVRQAEDQFIGKDKRRMQTWECLCSCGNTKIILGESLRSGKTKSCGCYASEFATMKRKTNTYYKENDYMVGLTSNGNRFYFDEEDLHLVKKHCWRLSPYGYVITNAHKDEGSHIIYLHRLIMSAPTGYEVDHINHDKTDNRKLNLRVCTRINNAWNNTGSSANTSGHRGVYWEKQTGRWFARITVRGEVLMLGYFDLFDDAVRARLDAEAHYFKEFAYNPNAARITQNTEEGKIYG